MSQFLLGILIIAIGGVLVWLGGHLATEGWKKWQQSSTQPIHKDKEQENSPLTPPTPKKEVSTKPTFYIFENETAEGVRTVSFWAWGEGTLSIGFECALGTTAEDTTGGFVEVDGRRIYTGKNMRRVFSHQINFTVSPGHHLITVGFDRRIYVAYVKIFGLRGVEDLRPAGNNVKIGKNYKSGNLAKSETKIVDQEQTKQTKLEFEKLITGKPINTNWPIKDEWKQLITNKKIIVIYSKESLYTAVEIVQRLHSLGAEVSYNIASELSFKGQPGNIYYQFSDFDIATAIQGAIVDIESFRLTSTGIRGQLLIWD